MTQTPKQIAGNQRRTLRKIREQLLTMANAWDEVDQFNLAALTDLADKAEEVSTVLINDDDLSEAA
jgi:hypothetical protein